MPQALKDVDYVVSEKNFFEKIFDCEMYSNISDSKGVFYFDNGHSFDKVLFYGNENSIFGFEYLLFIFLLFTTGNFLIAILSIGIVFKVISIQFEAVLFDNFFCSLQQFRGIYCFHIKLISGFRFVSFQLKKVVINHLTKNNLARKTLIDKRFLIWAFDGDLISEVNP